MKVKVLLVFSVVCLSLSFAKSVTTPRCPPLQEKLHINLKCFNAFTKSNVNCTASNHSPGTTAEYKCAHETYFNIQSFTERNFTENKPQLLRCDETGKWIGIQGYSVFKCGVYGNVNVTASDDICGIGDDLTNSQPWHAVILHQPVSGGKFKFRCGATLIKPTLGDTSIGGNLILTASACVVDSNGTVTRPRALKVVMGIVSVDANLEEIEKNIEEVHHFTVESIVIESEKSLALLKLKEKFRPTIYVHPICLDLENHFPVDLRNKTGEGQLVGLGDLIKQCNTQLNLEFVCEAFPDNVCCQPVVNSPQTKDGFNFDPCPKSKPHQFCARLIEDDGDSDEICPLDLGGGLAIEQNLPNQVFRQTHFLLGVLTETTKRCTDIGTFSAVRESLTWIQRQTKNLFQEV